MDCIPIYKPPKKPRRLLLEPPAYCRSAAKRMAHDKTSTEAVKLQESDPSRILLLVESLYDNNSKGLEKKINKYLQAETESQLCFLISIYKETAIVQALGTEKIDVKRYKISNKIIDKLYEISSEQHYLTYDKLHQSIQKVIVDMIGTHQPSLTIVPIFEKHSDPAAGWCVILVCLVNAKKEQPAIARLVRETFKFCLAILLNTTTSEEESRIRKECQTLLDVAKKLFQHLGDLGELLQEIMVEARNLTKAERCSLFLIDEYKENLVAKVFDGSVEQDFKFHKSKGIAGHVYSTGKILNITDAYGHPLFYREVDEKTGFRTKTILCFPIRDDEGIIGVAQLCNKKEGAFTVDDEEAAMAFSIYCGLAIMHSLVYKKIREAQVKTQLSNELMMYHMKVDEEMFENFLNCKLSHNYGRMGDFKFQPRHVSYEETPCFTLKMFEDLELIKQFNIKKELLCRFILYIMKGYRDTPYHNWIHAFSVTHFAYLMIKNFKLIEKNYMTRLEALALLVSCMGHDVDHRGTTNAFQLKIGSPLANLYSSEGSVMERHHLSQCICILNTQKCNFLECLDNKNYQRVLNLLHDNILATDLANHFKIRPVLQEFLELRYMKDRIDHKKYLFSLMMTCADLSDETKGFQEAREVVTKIYEEFFNQGDLEKVMGNKPLESMDREKASIPDLQIQFLDDVCLPAFRILAAIFPRGNELVAEIETLRAYWEVSKPIFEKHRVEGQSSLDTLHSSMLNAEVLKAMSANTSRNEVTGDDDDDDADPDADTTDAIVSGTMPSDFLNLNT